MRTSPSKTIAPDLLRAWRLPLHGGDKDARGRVLVVGGSINLPGPIILAATAALRAGAGKLQVATAAEAVLGVGCTVPEALVVAFDDAAALAEHADAIVFGPGMSEGGECARLLANIASRTRAPVLLDAAALYTLNNGAAPVPRNAVLTPHAREMAALLGRDPESVERDPQEALLSAVQRFQATIALKGERTYIASPASEKIYCNESGTAGLATSGSGDVLAGIIGGLLARGAQPLQATVWGVYLHARAGERLMQRSGIGFLAREIAAEVPPIIRELAP